MVWEVRGATGKSNRSAKHTFKDPPMYKSSNVASSSTITSSPFKIFSSSSAGPPPKKLKGNIHLFNDDGKKPHSGSTKITNRISSTQCSKDQNQRKFWMVIVKSLHNSMP